MKLDAREIPKSTLVKSDVCIIGAGAAGITLAREFNGTAFDVCLLESGGIQIDAQTQMLYRGQNAGIIYFPLEGCRLRFFGGSTNHWGGVCFPLEEIDFEKRDGVPYSGWPFTLSQLLPYYERAHPIVEIGPFNYDLGYWEDPEKNPRLPLIEDRVFTKLYQSSPPTHFGDAYGDELFNAQNVRVLLYANALELETDPTGQHLTRVRAGCLNGNGFSIEARHFVLAAGGLENVRLLLASNKVQEAGLGNSNDLVGRFFMDHLIMDSGALVPSNPYVDPDLYKKRPVKGVLIRGGLGLSADVLREEQLMNHWAGLMPQDPDEETQSEGFASLKRIRSAARKGEVAEDFWKHVGNVLGDLDEVAPILYNRATKGKAISMFAIRSHAEQAPNPASRVTLADERDELGLPMLRLDWRLSEVDKRSMLKTLGIVAAEVGRSGVGRVRIDLDPREDEWLEVDPLAQWWGPRGSYHHMGTTRMHDSPKLGVTDANCRVHEVSNLWVAGSSVFPTSGYANPTLTIVALALRLADHLKRLLK